MLSRLHGLRPVVAQSVIAAAQALEAGRPDEASRLLGPALLADADHPEVLRVHAGILSLRGKFVDAIPVMQRALVQRPDDPLYYNTLGTLLGTSGNFDEAISALRRACELEPGLALAWYNLGVLLTRCVRNEEAIQALQQAVRIAPDHMEARALLTDMLRVSGRTGEARVQYRKILQDSPWSGQAWWGLADLKIESFEDEDIGRMAEAWRHPRASDNDRIAIGFALAKALDDRGRYPEALDALARANAIARHQQQWDASIFRAGVDAILEAFAANPPAPDSSTLGQEAIFIIGVPRSGTTLVEQILASHSRVEGAGELPDLPLVLTEQSRRTGQPFPNWVAEMDAADWRRLGERYLDRTVHWRKQRPMFVDKLPNNWMYIGAIRAMLPSARIVACRRDALENCFSCYRQYLVDNEYQRTFDDLAAFWRDFDRSVTRWSALHPSHVYRHDYEDLVADPERSIRALLQFCGLSFEEACLHFHENARDVRSPSATQVRQPVRRDTARAARYGALLDPLRIALGLPLFAG